MTLEDILNSLSPQDEAGALVVIMDPADGSIIKGTGRQILKKGNWFREADGGLLERKVRSLSYIKGREIKVTLEKEG